MDNPPPSCSSQAICRVAGQKLCVSTGALVPGEALYQIHRQSLNTYRGKHRSMTVGILYGPGAETLILVTITLGTRKTKSAVYTRDTKRNRSLGIQCQDPNLSGGYQNYGWGIHRCANSKTVLRETRKFSRPLVYHRRGVVP